MPETPTIPPIDPELVDKAKQLGKESMEALRLVASLAERTGAVMEQMDGLLHDQPNEVADFLRHVTDYDKLMDTWFHIAGHASAAADDHLTGSPRPSWHEQLWRHRRARFEQVA